MSSDGELKSILFALRHVMKEKRVIYKDLIPILNLSESSIKRIFSQNALTLLQISKVCHFVGYSFFEICELASRKFARSHTYTPDQDRLLGNSPLAMYVFVRLMFGFTPVQLEEELKMKSKDMLKILVQLDKANLIELHAKSRIVVKARGPFVLPKGGHLARSLKTHISIILSHFHAKTDGVEEFEGLLHGREFYLPEDIYQNLKKELMGISVKYRQISTWMMHERKNFELSPVTILLGVDKFNVFAAVLERSQPH